MHEGRPAHFLIRTTRGLSLRFFAYTKEAPATVKAFLDCLPFQVILFHAKSSGEEIWTPEAPSLDIPQENASVFTHAGEIVLGPLKPSRVQTAGCMGIYYGRGQGVDACNIFGKILEEDLPRLRSLGEEIWKSGGQLLTFEAAKADASKPASGK